jgi:DnaJ-class molecular chaperone
MEPEEVEKAAETAANPPPRECDVCGGRGVVPTGGQNDYGWKLCEKCKGTGKAVDG